MRPITLFLLLLLAPGCAQMVWHKPGGSQAQLDIDLADARAHALEKTATAEALMQTISQAWQLGQTRKKLIINEMRKKGWQYVTAKRGQELADRDRRRQEHANKTPSTARAAEGAEEGFTR